MDWEPTGEVRLGGAGRQEAGWQAGDNTQSSLSSWADEPAGMEEGQLKSCLSGPVAPELGVEMKLILGPGFQS